MPELVAVGVGAMSFGAERLISAREYGHWRLDDDRSGMLASCELPSMKQKLTCQLKAVQLLDISNALVDSRS